MWYFTPLEPRTYGSGGTAYVQSRDPEGSRLQVEEGLMAKTRSGALAASTMVVALLAACGGSTGCKTTTPITPTKATEEAGALATRGAGSRAAKLGPTLLNTADFPPDLTVRQQGAQIVAAGDLPGLASEASRFFATVSTAAGDEFVNLTVVAADSDTDASTALDALTPANYLLKLTAGATDATASPLHVSSAPLGSKGFNYAGTVPASVTGQATGQHIAGEALGFVRGSTYVLLVHGVFAPSTRGIDVVEIAGAINARLSAP
jgi:hypothetical protein